MAIPKDRFSTFPIEEKPSPRPPGPANKSITPIEADNLTSVQIFVNGLYNQTSVQNQVNIKWRTQ